MKKNFFLIFLFLLTACSFEKTKYEKIKRENCKAETIYRQHDQVLFPLYDPISLKREAYPWEEKTATDLQKITSKHFHCKGSPTNAPVVIAKNNSVKTYHDCEGSHCHSLPMVHGKEGVYPILLDLLNYIQKKAQKKVVITCGHCCPIHNTYSDASDYNKKSKHMIGAEVDFYLQGMEDSTDKIIDYIITFYRERPGYKNSREYREFLRYDAKQLNISTPGWYNKEIFIKLYQSCEGRDYDNRHPYPYLSIQVRYDRDLKEPVVFSWDTALHGYKRW